jgi:hypothetical protein
MILTVWLGASPQRGQLDDTVSHVGCGAPPSTNHSRIPVAPTKTFRIRDHVQARGSTYPQSLRLAAQSTDSELKRYRNARFAGGLNVATDSLVRILYVSVGDIRRKDALREPPLFIEWSSGSERSVQGAAQCGSHCRELSGAAYPVPACAMHHYVEL